MVGESLGGGRAAARHPGPRDKVAMGGSLQAEPAPKAQTPPPPALFSCTARLSQRGLYCKFSGRQPVWGGQSPRSQATGSGGRPGNRLCCEASQSQGLVSQSHTGRSPLALAGQRPNLDTPGSGPMTDHCLAWLPGQKKGSRSEGRAGASRDRGADPDVLPLTNCARPQASQAPHQCRRGTHVCQ